MQHDLILTREFGIYTLPAYLIQSDDKNALVRTLIGYENFVSIIQELTNNKIIPKPPELSVKAFNDFLDKHPLISLLELKEAFDFKSIDAVREFINNNDISIRILPNDFIAKN